MSIDNSRYPFDPCQSLGDLRRDYADPPQQAPPDLREQPQHGRREAV